MGHRSSHINGFGDRSTIIAMDEWVDEKGRTFYSVAKAAQRCSPAREGWRQRAQNLASSSKPNPYEPQKVGGAWFLLASAVEADRKELLRTIRATEPNSARSASDPSRDKDQIERQLSSSSDVLVEHLKAEISKREHQLDLEREEHGRTRIALQRADDKSGELEEKLAVLRTNYRLMTEIAARAGLDEGAVLDELTAGPSSERSL